MSHDSHDFVWGQASATAARMELPSVIATLGNIRPEDIGPVWKAKVFRPSEHVWG